MDKLFKIYSIAEISQKTHISPMILGKLLEGDISSINKVKLKGFVKILKEEYPEFDFSSLEDMKEELKIETQEESIIKTDEIKQERKIGLYFIVLILLGMIGYLVYYLQISKTNPTNKIIASTNTTITNSDKKLLKDFNNTDKNISKPMMKIKIKPIKKYVNNTLVIIPQKEVWFKVTYLDNNVSKEYLTSHNVDLNGSKNLFIKFGHGMELLKYHGHTLFPDSEKITRVVLENGDLNITKNKLQEYMK